jgi:hypothetical protein
MDDRAERCYYQHATAIAPGHRRTGKADTDVGVARCLGYRLVGFGTYGMRFVAYDTFERLKKL